MDQEGKLKTFARVDHYRYRCEDENSPLLDLNIEEYFSLVKVVKKPKNNNNRNIDSSSSGRRQNARYPFHKDHPLCETHWQQVRSKLLVIVLICFRPTKAPVAMPDRENSPPARYAGWLKKANVFGAFYGTFLAPWNFDGLCPVFNWQTFSEYVQTRWKNPDYNLRYFMKARRLKYLNNVLKHLRTSARSAKLTSNFRRKFATRFSEQDKVRHWNKRSLDSQEEHDLRESAANWVDIA